MIENFDMELFQKISLERCNGPFNCADQPLLYWSTAIAEEAGEIAGVAKKMARGFNKRELLKMRKKHGEEKTDTELEQMWFVEKKEQLAEEAADLFTYIDLLAQKSGFDLWAAVTSKFNRVSEEMQCTEYMLPTSRTESAKPAEPKINEL